MGKRKLSDAKWRGRRKGTPGRRNSLRKDGGKQFSVAGMQSLREEWQKVSESEWGKQGFSATSRSLTYS